MQIVYSEKDLRSVIGWKNKNIVYNTILFSRTKFYYTIRSEKLIHTAQ